MKFNVGDAVHVLTPMGSDLSNDGIVVESSGSKAVVKLMCNVKGCEMDPDKHIFLYGYNQLELILQDGDASEEL